MLILQVMSPRKKARRWKRSKRHQRSKALHTQLAGEGPATWQNLTRNTLTRLDKRRMLMCLPYCYQKAKIAQAEASDCVAYFLGLWLTFCIQGGKANVYTPSNEEVEKARMHNERIRRESFNKKDASLKRKIVEKAKEKLPGKSPSREPSERA